MLRPCSVVAFWTDKKCTWHPYEKKKSLEKLSCGNHFDSLVSLSLFLFLELFWAYFCWIWFLYVIYKLAWWEELGRVMVNNEINAFDMLRNWTTKVTSPEEKQRKKDDAGSIYLFNSQSNALLFICTAIWILLALELRNKQTSKQTVATFLTIDLQLARSYIVI